MWAEAWLVAFLDNRGSAMAHTSQASPGRPWLIGGASLLFHGLATFDHAATLVGGEAYMRGSGMSADQIAYFSSLPFWVFLAWALSVWAGLFGSLALLAARSEAAGLFATATAGTAGYVVWSFWLSDGIAAMGAMWFMPPVVGVATLALAAYARRRAPRSSD